MNTENINEVIEFGKKAVVELKNNTNLDKFDEYLEQGFQVFPKQLDKEDTFMDLGYRFIKTAVKGHLDNQNLIPAKKWLDRLIEFNNIAHLSDEEVGFYSGRYFYEIGNLDEAYNQWREVVRGSGGKNHFRFFEGEDKKYLEFYKSQTKLREKK